jgi:hypothetical protein
MKMKSLSLLTLAAALLGAGCGSTYDKGPYLAETSKTPPYEMMEKFVLLDPDLQYSITCVGLQEKWLDDGRLQVAVQIRNRENRRIEVQANCVFKDADRVSTGDDTPFQALILTENATETLKFTSTNDRAKKFTVRVRQAR